MNKENVMNKYAGTQSEKNLMTVILYEEQKRDD